MPARDRHLTGFALAVEIGDWRRFSGKTIGAYLGLVPSEYSTGQSRSQGGITKTGNAHARRLLVEAAWQERASTAARVRGEAGNERLHRQWQRMTARRKKPVIANVAIARELAGWCRSLATIDD